LKKTSYFHKKEQLGDIFLEMKGIERKLFTSKHHIQQLKADLQNDSAENMHMTKQLESLREEVLAAENKANHEGVEKLQEAVKELRSFLKNIKGNEAKWRQDIKGKTAAITELKGRQKQLQQEIERYKQVIVMQEQTAKELFRMLENKNQVIQKQMADAEGRTRAAAQSLEKERFELQQTMHAQHQMLLYHEQHEACLYEKLEEMSRFIAALQNEAAELKGHLEQVDPLIVNRTRQPQDMNNNWVEFGDEQSKQRQYEVNTIKRGSWLQMVWNLWSKEHNVEYIEKMEQLSSTVKELQQGLGQYEQKLNQMNDCFQRYEQNEVNHSQQIKELNKHLQSFTSKEEVYMSKLEQFEAKIKEYQEQNQIYKQQVEELSGALLEMEEKEKSYKSKVEQLKRQNSQQAQQLNKSALGVQEKQNQYREPFQQLVHQPQGKYETMKSSVRQEKQRRPVNPARRPEQDLKEAPADMLKRYYPQAQSRMSPFNPFKYS
jgi:chromosome segregation ATPase